MSQDFRHMSEQQLKNVISNAQGELDKKHSNKLETLRKELKKQIENAGFKLEEVFPSGKAQTKTSSKRKPIKGAGVAKFRDPNDPSRVWTGFGPKPGWLVALEKKGYTVAQLTAGAEKTAATPAVKPAAKPSAKPAAKPVAKKASQPAAKKAAKKAVKKAVTKAKAAAK